MTDDRVEFEYIPLSQLIAYPRNPKEHDIGAIYSAINSSVGFASAITIDTTTGYIGAGHGRIEVLQQMYNSNPKKPPKRILIGDNGEWLIPVNKVAFADETELQQFLIMDNRISEIGGWDEPALADLLKDLAEAGDGILELTGYDSNDLDDLLKNLEPIAPLEDAEPQVNKADELQKQWQTKRGQVWLVGGVHRVMCGDSTSADDVARLLENRIIDATITDPPYMTTDLDFDEVGVSYDFWRIAQAHTHNNGYFAMFAPVEMLADCAKEWHLRFTGCWVKEKGGMRTASAKKPMRQFETYAVFAHPEHKISDLVWNTIYFEGEPYQKVQKNTGYKRGGNDQLDRSNVSSWTNDGFVSVNDGEREYTDVLFGGSKGAMKHNERTLHPTQKPIEVVSVIIQWLTNTDMLVYEPFLGSGTTLIACAQTGRVCYGMEISPAYVAVVLQRAKDVGLECELLS